MPRICIRLVVITLLLCGAAKPALTADADALVREGIELRRNGQDEAALARFREAYKIDSSPRSLAQIGLAEQALGNWSAADEDLSHALESVTDAWIRKNRRLLEQALRDVDSHMGGLEIVGRPAGAEVRVDGRIVGRLPLPKRLRAHLGTVVVEVHASGFVSVSRPVQIVSEGLTRESVDLQPVTLSGQQPGDRKSDSAPPLRAAAVPVAPPQSAPSQPLSGSRRGLILAAAVGAGLATGWGVTETVIHENRVSSFNSSAACTKTAPALWTRTCSDLYTQGNQAQHLSIVGYALGAALATTSIVLWVTRPHQPNETPSVACVLLPPALGASCSLRF